METKEERQTKLIDTMMDLMQMLTIELNDAVGFMETHLDKEDPRLLDKMKLIHYVLKAPWMLTGFMQDSMQEKDGK